MERCPSDESGGGPVPQSAVRLQPLQEFTILHKALLGRYLAIVLGGLGRLRVDVVDVHLVGYVGFAPFGSQRSTLTPLP